MAHIWPIGGGKGGSGKSFITSSLGRLSAGLGRKTLVIDLDLGAANLHTLVGISYPSKSLSDFLQKKTERLDDTVETYSACAEVMEIIDFIRADGNRPLCLPEREV